MISLHNLRVFLIVCIIMMGGMIVLFSSSTMHAGEWNDGKLLGQDEGLVDAYEGERKYDKSVTVKYADGSEYSGDFHNDKYHGHGTYKWANGDVYIGEWMEGVRSRLGLGTYKWAANGDVYIGEFKDGNRHGQGRLKFRRIRV